MAAGSDGAADVLLMVDGSIELDAASVGFWRFCDGGAEDAGSSSAARLRENGFK